MSTQDWELSRMELRCAVCGERRILVMRSPAASWACEPCTKQRDQASGAGDPPKVHEITITDGIGMADR
jgi:hypothetical protein